MASAGAWPGGPPAASVASPAAWAGGTPVSTRVRMARSRIRSSEVYRRCPPALRPDGPIPCRRSQVRRVAAGMPSCRAAPLTVNTGPGRDAAAGVTIRAA